MCAMIKYPEFCLIVLFLSCDTFNMFLCIIDIWLYQCHFWHLYDNLIVFLFRLFSSHGCTFQSYNISPVIEM